MTDICALCKFWQRKAPEKEKDASHETMTVHHIGRCRRYAPSKAGILSVWPETHSRDWCGEWAVAPDEIRQRNAVAVISIAKEPPQ